MAEEQKIGSTMEQEIPSGSEIDTDSDSDDELKKLEHNETKNILVDYHPHLQHMFQHHRPPVGTDPRDSKNPESFSRSSCEHTNMAPKPQDYIKKISNSNNFHANYFICQFPKYRSLPT